VNSEELEQSLRTEFESYLRSFVAEMRQEASEFQNRINADLDKQKAQFDEAFQGFAARFDSERTFDDAFRGSVAEHLRLARDEGARITANALAEAEKLDTPAATAPARYDSLRDAVNDISTKDSQSAILKSLVSHAAEFAPRGAFFIIKNEHIVGWKVFGTDNQNAESSVREIHFPLSSDSIIASSVSSQRTSESSAGTHSDDSAFLDALQFGHPDRMYAIPLMARGRGVAVLYADHGEGGDVNVEALETLSRVAGLTVELLASSHTAQAEDRELGTADFEEARHEDVQEEPGVSVVTEPASFDEPVGDSPASDFAFVNSSPFDSEALSPAASYEPEPQPETSFDTFETTPSFDSPPPVEETAFGDYATQDFAASPSAFDTTPEVDHAMVYDSGGSIEPAAFDSSPFDKAVEEFQPAAAVGGNVYTQVLEPVAEIPAAPAPQARLSDRPVDLPIEVSDSERRIHNDARRFARLLVSEIKLYNEKKVIEGRESQDLYDRLREAIDRSREMYDKRVQPPVAEKFDYFHYELVNSLADGDAGRLGSTYPGASV